MGWVSGGLWGQGKPLVKWLCSRECRGHMCVVMRDMACITGWMTGPSVKTYSPVKPEVLGDILQW